MKIYEKKNYNLILSYHKLLGVTACLSRFFNISKVLHSNQFFGILTSEEIIKTETVIFKTEQKESFSRPKDKYLKALQCFMHANEILKFKT